MENKNQTESLEKTQTTTENAPTLYSKVPKKLFGIFILWFLFDLIVAFFIFSIMMLAYFSAVGDTSTVVNKTALTIGNLLQVLLFQPFIYLFIVIFSIVKGRVKNPFIVFLGINGFLFFPFSLILVALSLFVFTRKDVAGFLSNNQSEKKYTLWSLLPIALSIIVLIVYFIVVMPPYIRTLLGNPTRYTKTSISTPASPTSSPTASWKTYASSDPQFPFIVSYPPLFKKVSTVGKDLVINRISVYFGTETDDKHYLLIDANKEDPKMLATILTALSQKNYSGGDYEIYTGFTTTPVASNTATIFYSKPNPNAPIGPEGGQLPKDEFIEVIFNQKNILYQIKYRGISEKDRKEFDQILSTFKFTN